MDKMQEDPMILYVSYVLLKMVLDIIEELLLNTTMKLLLTFC